MCRERELERFLLHGGRFDGESVDVYSASGVPIDGVIRRINPTHPDYKNSETSCENLVINITNYYRNVLCHQGRGATSVARYWFYSTDKDISHWGQDEMERVFEKLMEHRRGLYPTSSPFTPLARQGW